MDMKAITRAKAMAKCKAKDMKAKTWAKAGVIGKNKFTYDLWGNTVNVASRMESSGTPGRIQISTQTAELLDDTFALESRGLVQAKGLGEVATFYVNGLQGSTTDP